MAALAIRRQGENMPKTTEKWQFNDPKSEYEFMAEDIVRLVSGPSTLPSKPPNPHGPAAENPAVFRCCQAYTVALVEAIDLEKSRIARESDIGRAYRDALPPLAGRENITDFIACVAHGMLLNVISGPDAARLLYAAQVAHSASSPEPLKYPKRRE